MAFAVGMSGERTAKITVYWTNAVHGKMMQLVKERSPRNPVLIALITMSLLPLGILGVAMYQSALVAIRGAAFQRVELASGLIANTVSLGFAELAAEIQVTASLPRVPTSSAELIKGFVNLIRIRQMKIVFAAGYSLITQQQSMKIQMKIRSKNRNRMMP